MIYIIAVLLGDSEYEAQQDTGAIAKALAQINEQLAIRNRYTATVPKIPFAKLCEMRDRIIATVPGVNRVLWDISEKPVATIEWE